MVNNVAQPGLAFSVTTNVHVEVVDKAHNEIRQVLDVHNKASRNMIKGLLRFLMGYYTVSNRNPNENSRINFEDVTKYIPCYVNFGDGGVIMVDGKPSYISPRIPDLEADWIKYVNYSDDTLTHELNTGSRVEIGSFSDSFSNGNIKDAVFGDADQIIYSTTVPPGHCNVYDTGDVKLRPCCISEIGLFASSKVGASDLLAKIKLTNRQTSLGTTITDTLYVRPQDTIILTWTISIMALGEDSIYTGVDLEGNTINYELDSTIGFIPVEDVESEENEGG